MELEYKVKQGQTIFDVSNISLYGMDNIVLGLLNPSNKSFVDTLTNETLIYNDSYTQDNTIQLQLNVSDPVSEYTVKGQDGQSSFDLCIMNYGNLDKIISMLSDNSNLVSINDVDVSMKDIIFNTEKLTEAYVPNIIKTKRYSFATINKNVESGNIIWDGVYGIWDGENILTF